MTKDPQRERIQQDFDGVIYDQRSPKIVITKIPQDLEISRNGTDLGVGSLSSFLVNQGWEYLGEPQVKLIRLWDRFFF